MKFEFLRKKNNKFGTASVFNNFYDDCFASVIIYLKLRNDIDYWMLYVNDKNYYVNKQLNAFYTTKSS